MENNQNNKKEADNETDSEKSQKQIGGNNNENWVN